MGRTSSYSGIGVVNATFKVNATTFAAIKDDLDGACGKGVALTANDEVGFGLAAGSPLFGILQKVEADGCATVTFRGFVEGVPMVAVGETPAMPAIGSTGLGVDDEGNVQSLATGNLGTVVSVGAASGTVLL